MLGTPYERLMSVDPPERDDRSYADLVYEVLRSAAAPLTFDEIFARVNAIRSVRTRDPVATVRGALSQGAQLVSVGDGRYGYLPHLIERSVVRLPLDTTDPAHHPLAYPDEVRQVLWPIFFDIQKRKLDRSVRMRLPTGDAAHLPLELLGEGTWGTHLPPELGRYLVSERATHGDALIIQIADGEAGVCDARIDHLAERDELAVARRDHELAAAAREFLQRNRSVVVPIWELVVGLLACGAYRALFHHIHWKTC
jgi:hypothetical protein